MRHGFTASGGPVGESPFDSPASSASSRTGIDYPVLESEESEESEGVSVGVAAGSTGCRTTV